MSMTLPNATTAAGLAAGAASIAASQREHFPIAASLLVAALILDRLDGVLARRLGQSSEFGARLDSLADLVSFGVAPVVLVHGLVRRAGVDSAFVLGAGVVWIVAAGWRLARFSEDGMVDSRWGRAFVGVPTPGAAAWLLLLAALLPVEYLAPGAIAGLALGAVVMLSRIPYPRNGPVLGATVLGLVVTLSIFWRGPG